MKLAKYGLSAMVLCFFSGLAFADSISTIPITGTAWYGFATSFGDFSFQGPGLNLFQSSPDGPNIIASCLPGTTCSLGFGIPNALEYCGYCTSYSSGSLGSNVAEFLEVESLGFSGSAFYPGGDSLLMPMSFSGAISGFQLLNCDSNGLGCTLGPKEFTVYVSGHGTGQLTFVGPGEVSGVMINLSGTASTVPEPISLVLTGTGLVAVCVRKKLSRTRQI